MPTFSGKVFTLLDVSGGVEPPYAIVSTHYCFYAYILAVNCIGHILRHFVKFSTMLLVDPTLG